ncbi:molybdopterin-dependent oxidoreductase [Pedobacter sp. MC2016-15]|uniref:molybdopterin-dependent oxidoreductase n=1 Tax=Pedobacter sp. MC2016-15 TaxID=2994473 RepID=UPI002246B292|nr:molybdopterin-dependent oxidoreductase [Pedobacter sp. MC2016-15]MCX2479687.1 molybdopterin-dependent oxidoreductase [Pedobacter sp. MC2016-15]
MKKKFLLTSTLAILLCSLSAVQAQTAEVSVAGSVGKPYNLNAATFSTLKKVDVTVKDHDAKDHHYSGVSLYDIISKAEAVPGNMLKGKTMAKFVLITAADNYQVVLAIPEFDPAFTDRVIVLADKEDGEALAANLGPYRLIVPGDKKPARSVMRVTSIEVLDARKP